MIVLLLTKLLCNGTLCLPNEMALYLKHFSVHPFISSIACCILWTDYLVLVLTMDFHSFRFVCLTYFSCGFKCFQCTESASFLPILCCHCMFLITFFSVHLIFFHFNAAVLAKRVQDAIQKKNMRSFSHIFSPNMVRVAPTCRIFCM